MAYMRGDYYIYKGGEGLYISTPDGQAILPTAIFDELVAMRWAQLPVNARLQAEKRAVKNWQGNFGCDALCKKLKLETTSDIIKKYSKRKKNGGEKI